MNEFNRLIDFQPSLSPDAPSSPRDKDRAKRQPRLILDEVRLPAQEEKNY
jgi:hypothetical protein